MNDWIAHWYYHIPDALLAMLCVVMLGQAVASVLPEGVRGTRALRVLERAARPALGAVRGITPGVIGGGALAIATLGWLMALRIVWYVACTAAGMRLSLIN